jgi:hypothetical protein
MAIQHDQLTNTISVNDTVNANSSLNLVGQGTGAVNLKGTGENLLLQSQALATSPWTPNGITATNNSATAPDNTSTASLITATAGTSAHYDFSGGTPAYNQNITYTVSFYAKSGTTRYVQFGIGGTGSIYANFDITSGTVGTTAGLTSSSITFVGNGWYRCVCVFSYASTGTTGVAIAIQSSSSDTRLQSWTAAGTETVYIWGVQAEIGFTANAYVPTTSTAVYGTPSLSFSGVAGVGLQSDGSLYVSPAGTGAIQAQATTSTATGGNARGANAVDWQTARGSAASVASSSYGVVSGGYDNRATGGYGGVGSGLGNIASATASYVGTGNGNTASGYYASVFSGHNNTAAGYFNFIGNGDTNSGTSNSAVTTQATTTVTSGSTAVTLSGSNASIKVGQFITGTGIPNFTYVAAISGTSLTLSQNANASGSPTLSFYTPHGIVVGGGNNQATGSYSVIVGGGDAGTSSNRNVASGDWSFVGGGWKNTASGLGAVVVGGGFSSSNTASGNTASSSSAFVGAGVSNNASGIYSFIGGGNSNVADASYSSVLGNFGATRSIQGYIVLSASYNPLGTYSTGTQQSALLIIGTQTTTASATVLTSNGSAASTTNQVILANNSAYYVVGTIIAGVTGGGNTSAWNFVGAIKRGANAGSTAIVGTGITATLVSQDAGASGWAVSITADTTNGGLAVTVTGQASTTIRWVCKVETTEMTF